MGEQKGDEVPPTDEDMQFAEDLDGDLEDKTGQAGAEPDITVRENDDGSRVIEIDYDKEGGGAVVEGERDAEGDDRGDRGDEDRGDDRGDEDRGGGPDGE
ncbi:hypothetical protein [Cupriavidus sp. UYPR2.512]|uniref:hypothetical protein n=1 Tax=Cupriavidus sp. UYPR2.512 TaxID=1080187 RepID=UPI0003751839|nr:hypothetical protein [Cupriavidus sp. UYPR2.512]